MLTLQQCPIDVSNPPTSCSPSNILPLLHACVILSDSYHAYAPAAPYRYVSLPTTPCPQSTILILLHSLLFFPLLTMLTLPLCPIDMHPPATPCLPSRILMLPHTQFIPSAIYHAYAPAVPPIYDSAPATQYLNLHTPCCLPCLSRPQCPIYIPPAPLSMWYASHF
ncbi:hypothetical protein O181_068789 [Austropuccinia psidii MF-1]|uniref:Uncharacterized protein n=1 Tax=Austropuccinia psidii MF-1 TaxID=1389203 RepID=A0A9Q3I7X1_9BASI|nr:hypothetical protein [Austropuccinia psidii MF-1]